MKIDYTARRIRIDDRVRDVVGKKLGKLARVLPDDAQAHVVVRSEKNAVAVEVTVVGGQRTWTATETADDQETAALAALERIEAQAKKTKAKVKEVKKQRGSPTIRKEAAWVPAAGIARPPSNARRETISPRSMFEEDALSAFASSKKEALIFRDLSDDGLRFLYRRTDGSIGLLVPK